MAGPCTHLDLVDPDALPSGAGCAECLADGGQWVHLRICRTCGHVGCCDSSPGQHASAHAGPEHPVVSSFEPGEDWWWCYLEERGFLQPSASNFDHAHWPTATHGD